MRPESQRLCEAIWSQASRIPDTKIGSSELEWEMSAGTTCLSVSEVGNTNPAVVTVNVGTTITYAQVDDPDLLPQPTASRYEAVLTPYEHWVDLLDGDNATADEIAVAAVTVFEQYIEDARR